ncbi:MAG: ABC transporter substrate-binding protein, partial [candidate division NC10 bacterium]
MTSEREDRTQLSRRDVLKTVAAGAGAAALGSLGFPAVVRSQPDAIRIGHLTPRTGFLGQLGEYGLNAATLAVEEANAAGGVLGRKVELIAEDSVNPGVAVTKVQKLVERDRVLGLLGEISSASALAIGEQANRYKVVYINTGANSDELRGKNCNRFMFHVEGCNTMYTKTIGQWQKGKNLIRGAKWYMLTADYAFGHDLFRVSSRFLTE